MAHFSYNRLKFVECNPILLKEFGGVVGNAHCFALGKVHGAVLAVEDKAE
jgi:hypothetical protein